MPLPDGLLKRLAELRKVVGDNRLFWSGDCNPKSAVGDWQRSLRKLFELAGIKGHAHRFRTTMAVNLLEKGIPMESVAAILGNSVKVVERHYQPWIDRRQISLEEAMKKTWA
jgi:site-specific recombinase XerD